MRPRTRATRSACAADGSVDLAFIDAAHDYRNVRADVLAYWPKLKPDGVLAGHDFLHYRNWAEVSRAPARPATTSHVDHVSDL